MRALCEAVGITPQAYYQERQRRAWETARDARVLSLVRMVRCRHPKMGTRKLLVQLRPQLEQEGLRIGRDQLFDLLREAHMLVRRERQPRRTTWAGRLRLPNRVAGLTVRQIDQVWVTDITYLALQNGHFVYWFVVMDLFSRAILGAVLARSLEAQHALAALQQAAQRAGRPLAGLIHHSDHGVQYTSHPYQKELRAQGIVASMGEVGSSYDNAYAERVIGILKQEYGLGLPFADEAQARYAATEGVYLYNHERPHQSLAYAYPMTVYTGRAAADAFTVYQYEPVEAIPAAS
ncbi:MAG: IS3 family transposase [Anaerolineae bacterium]|nr:IS3 family transposase [Anaerolineae bacterium]